MEHQGVQRSPFALKPLGWQIVGVVVAIAAAGVLWFWLRAPWLNYPGPANPDEAQLTAGAAQWWWGWPVIWAHLDLNTSGPLNAMPLIWPLIVGQVPTVVSSRLTGFVLDFGSFAFLTLATLIATRRLLLASISLPPLLFLGLSTTRDFAHYSSEKLSISLLSLCILLLIVFVQKPRTWLLLIVGIILGAIPFCKLQSTPLAALVAVFAAVAAVFFAGNVARRVTIARLAVLCAGSLVPILFLVGPLVLAGDLDTFTKGYLGLGVGYTAGGSGRGPAFVFDSLGSLASSWLLPAFALALIVGLLLLAQGRERRPTGALAALAAAVILSAVAFLTVLAPGREFQHYAQFWLWLGSWCPLAVCYALDAFAGFGVIVRRSVPVLSAIVLVVLGSSYFPDWQTLQGRSKSMIGADPQLGTMFYQRPLLLDWLGIDTRRIFVWGWAPNIYNLAGATAVSRESNTVLLDNTAGVSAKAAANSAYYRARLLSDIKRDGPFDLLVDGVAFGEFGLQDAAVHGLTKTFPELLTSSVDDPFSLFSKDWDIGGGRSCPRIYLRRSAIAGVEARLTPIKSAVSDSVLHDGDTTYGADHLIDRSVFENCGDEWLLPNGQQSGSATLSFDPTAPSELWVLNTRGSAGLNHAAKTASVSFRLGASEVWSIKNAAIAPYPTWTTFKLPPGLQADGLVVTIETAAGASGGLNEIALVRTAPGATTP